MIKNIILLVLVGAFWPWGAFCQYKLREKQLLPGDKLPQLLMKLDNFHKKEMYLSDFKGKLVVLAMWNNSDASEKLSQQYWSTLDQLQKKYKSSLQIILVNPHDEKKDAKAYFNKRQQKEWVDLPVMYKDDSLKSLIPFGTDLACWIDQDGYYITASANSIVVEDNIRAAINHEPINKKINDPPKVVGLGIGDAIPDYTFKNMLNYPAGTAKLDDFKGKLVILDFWSTYCSSCIDSWPKLLKLQEEFGNKIQIILVTYQDQATVRKQFERRRRIAGVNMTLPAVYGDSVLRKKVFPHTSVPHLVWIDEQGIVQSITSSIELTGKNLAKALHTGDFKMPQKLQSDEYISIEPSKPLFVNGNGNWDRENINVLWQSFFSKGVREIRSPVYSMIYRYHSMININHASIKMLYALAYNDIANGAAYLLDNRIFFKAGNHVKYSGEKDGKRDYNHLYIYQLLASRKVTQQQLQRRMQADLLGNIGLEANWEKHRKKCLVLSSTDTTLFAYKEGVESNGLSPYKTIVLNAITMASFVWQLHTDVYAHSPYPIVNETGYSGLIGRITLDVDIRNHEALDQALRKYGLRFILEEREVDVLVLSEPEGYVFPYDMDETRSAFK